MKIENILKTTPTLPLSKKVVVNLLYTNSVVIGILNDVLKTYDISIQQFNVLRILRGQKGVPVTLSIIQERMIAKMSNTTRLVDKLIIKGYATKKTNEKNKRKIDISITQAGLNFLNEIDALVDSAEQDIVNMLSENDKLELIRLLEKLRLIAN
ncbi:MarR family transcriptional regulator [Flavobacteriaceae bacterium SZ-1-7]|uniref:MarR family winged helix-turn-helix transcriptional regulator n=1 Tax=Tamlana sedimenti TaxID=3134126 RepID=UPI00312A34C5